MRLPAHAASRSAVKPPARSLVRLILPGVFVACLAAVALAAPAAAEAAPARGVSLHPNWWFTPPIGATDAEMVREIQAARSLNVDTVRVTLPWHALEPVRAGQWDTGMAARVDDLMNAVGANHLKAQVTVYGTPCWAHVDPPNCDPNSREDPYSPSADPQAFGNAIGRMIDRWGTRISAVEVWNEPNIAENFRGTPAEYADLVNATDTALAGRPWSGQLLAGALAMTSTPSGIEWVRELYDAGMSGHDAISIHPYEISYDEQDGIQLGDPLASGSQFARDIDGMRAEMRARGEAAKGIWITEFGVPACPADPVCVAELTQSTSLVGAFLSAELRPFVRGTVAYTLRDWVVDSSDWGDRFGLLRHDFSERLAATALRLQFLVPPVTPNQTARTLSVTRSGDGEVRSNSTSINCGLRCTETVDDGMEIVLTARPAIGSHFTGWSGCPSPDGDKCVLSVQGDHTIGASFVPIDRKITVHRNAGGRVTSVPAGVDCGTNCGLTVPNLSPVTLEAHPAAGYKLSGWSGCDEASERFCNVWPASDRTVTATFVRVGRLSVQKSGAGTVTSPEGINCGSTCSLEGSPGTGVTLTATPGPGHVFGGWWGCPEASGSQCVVTLDLEHTVGAIFTPLRTVTVQRSGSGSVKSTPAGVDCGSDCSTSVVEGTALALEATPAPGYAFAGWSGCDQADGRFCNLWPSADRTVTATFTRVGRLTVQKSGSGTITSPAGIDCGSTCSLETAHGAAVTLTASPAPGFVFGGWWGCPAPNGPQCNATLTAELTVGAIFTPLRTVTVQRSGSGSVKSTPAGVDCGSDCSTSVVEGTALALEATPAPGYAFAGWSGCDQADGRFCNLWPSADRAVTATFVPVRSLTVERTAGGSVSSNPAGIDCGSRCTVEKPPGTEVSLVAVPSPGFVFAGWRDCPAAEETRCTLKLDSNVVVGASFLPIRTVSVAPSVGGSVKSSPSGIDCGTTCSTSVTGVTLLTLAAVPHAGYEFAGWTGCDQSDGPYCNIWTDGDRHVSARFVRMRTITVQRTGEGRVTGTLGIECGGSCAATEREGTEFVLTAEPAVGHAFAGWDGCPTANGARCAVRLDSDLTVTANFAVAARLSVRASGAGRVFGGAGAIECGTRCDVDYPVGAEVKLVGVADPGHRFDHWSGCGAPSGSECLKRVDGTEVTAVFAPVPTAAQAPAAADPPPKKKRKKKRKKRRGGAAGSRR
jgi:hypothetical protein